MNIVKVPQNVFTDIRSEQRMKGFGNKVYQNIYSFFKKYPDQRPLYKIEPSLKVGFDEESIYSKFGIILEDSLVTEVENREYLVIIDPLEASIGLEKYLESWISKNLPEDSIPTYFVIDKELETYEEFYFWVEEIRKIYPNIYPLSDYSNLVKKRAREKGMDGMIADAVSLGYFPLFIDKEIESIVSEFRYLNANTLSKIKEAEDKILSEYKKNKNIILMYSGSYENIGSVAAFCAYMFYKYRINSHLDYSTTRLYLGNLSSLLFDRSRMLVEDQLKFLKSLPNVAVMFNEDYTLSYVTYLDTQAMDCKVSLVYADYSNLDSAKPYRVKMDLDDIVFIPLDYEVGLSVRNLTKFRENHDEFFNNLVKFENICESSKLMDVTNTFFMEVNGKKRIAHVEGIELSIPSVLFPTNKELTKTGITLTLNDLNRLYPINVLGGYKHSFADAILEIKKAYYKVAGTDKGINFKFYKHEREMGLLLKYYNNSGPNLLNISEFKDYVTLGLWWEETHKYRVGLSKIISKYLDPKKSRYYNKFFSIFGGPFALFGDELVLREEFLKEW